MLAKLSSCFGNIFRSIKRRQMSIPAQSKSMGKIMLDYAEEALPEILRSKTIGNKILDEFHQHHYWLRVFFSKSEVFPKYLRSIVLATNIFLNLFIQSAVYYYITDDSSCDDFSNELSCEKPFSSFYTEKPKCRWLADNQYTKSGHCAYVQPYRDLLVLLMVATFSAMISAPVIAIVNWLAMKVLSASSKRWVFRNGKLVSYDYGGTKRRPSAIVPEIVDNLNKATYNKMCKDAAMVEFHELKDKIIRYRSDHLLIEDRQEFDSLWGLDNSGHFSEIVPASSSSRFSCHCPRKSNPSELLINDLEEIQQSMIIEKKFLETRKSDDAKCRRLLFLFQRDLLPEAFAYILDWKSSVQSTELKGKSRSSKGLAWTFIIILNLTCVISLLSFAMMESNDSQKALANTFGVWLMLDIAFINSLVVMNFHVIIPMFLMNDIYKIKQKLLENMVKYYREVRLDKLGISKAKDYFNAAEYLSISYRMAQELAESPIARIVSHFSSPLPKKSYKVESEYLASLVSSLSAFSLRVVKFFFKLPSLAQDILILVMMSAFAGYLLVLHIRLYKVFPALIIIPLLFCFAVSHFITRALGGTAKIKRIRLLHAINSTESKTKKNQIYRISEQTENDSEDSGDGDEKSDNRDEDSRLHLPSSSMHQQDQENSSATTKIPAVAEFKPSDISRLSVIKEQDQESVSNSDSSKPVSTGPKGAKRSMAGKEALKPIAESISDGAKDGTKEKAKASKRSTLVVGKDPVKATEESKPESISASVSPSVSEEPKVARRTNLVVRKEPAKTTAEEPQPQQSSSSNNSIPAEKSQLEVSKEPAKRVEEPKQDNSSIKSIPEEPKISRRSNLSVRKDPAKLVEEANDKEHISKANAGSDNSTVAANKSSPDPKARSSSKKLTGAGADENRSKQRAPPSDDSSNSDDDPLDMHDPDFQKFLEECGSENSVYSL